MSESNLLFLAFSGQQNQIVLRRPFVRWVGYEAAAVLDYILTNIQPDESGEYQPHWSCYTSVMAEALCLSNDELLATLDRLDSIGLLSYHADKGRLNLLISDVDGQELDEQLFTFLADEWAAGEVDR
jgi:hypothetical protein